MIPWIVRVIAFFLCLVCFKEASAGYLFFTGTRASTDYPEVKLLKHAVSLSGEHPRYLQAFGQALRKEFERTGNKQSLMQANQVFEQLTQEIPFYGKAWLYRAEVKLALQHKEFGVISDEVWNDVKTMLQKAKSQSPGNVWISYRSGLNALRYRWKDAAANSEGLSDLYNAGKALPSIYLKPILNELLRRYASEPLLIRMTPGIYEAYEILREFSEEKKLWKLREGIGPRLNQLKELECRQLTQEGEDLLQNGDSRLAHLSFQKAFWLNPASPSAKAGMIRSEYDLGQLSRAEALETLRDLFEDEEKRKALVEQIVSLGPVVTELGDSYLKGLYAFDRGRWSQALKEFGDSRTTGRYRKRYLAEAYQKLGKNAKVREILLPLLKEKNVDLRELLILRNSVSGEELSLVEAKIQEEQRSRVEANAWRGRGMEKGLLDRNGKIGVVLNLVPGETIFHIPLRSLSKEKDNHGFIHLRLGEELLGSFYVNHSSWRRKTVKVHTSGGRRWLNLELVNGQDEINEKRPAVAIGEMRVIANG